jgi:predicted amidohydrolase YtcJ
VSVAFLVFLFFCLSSFGQAKADFVLYNAKVYTMNAGFQTVEAVAIKDGRIVELGKSATLLAKYKQAKKVDAAGKSVYPGFIDAHAHFLGYAHSLITVDLTGTTSWEDCLERIRDFINKKSLTPGTLGPGQGLGSKRLAGKGISRQAKTGQPVPGLSHFPNEDRRARGHCKSVGARQGRRKGGAGTSGRKG